MDNYVRIRDLREDVWGYFKLHASQRLTTFNFYIIFSTVLIGGYFASIQSTALTQIGVVIGILMSLLAFTFWKLDQRTNFLIKNAERTLKHLEDELYSEDETIPDFMMIYSYEEKQTLAIRSINSFWPWKKHLSYSSCFNFIFLIFGVSGFIAAVYSIVSLI